MSLSSQLESLLFAAGRPLSIKELAKVTEIKAQEINSGLKELADYYQKNNRGLQLINNGRQYQLTTASGNSKLVSRLLKDEISGELTRPSLEALTIIAYRGPVTKAEIEKIRGVNCSLILRNLLLRGLIEENFDKRKQENYYSVSLDFIRHLGINDCQQLPDFEKLNSQEDLKELLEEDKEEV